MNPSPSNSIVPFQQDLNASSDTRSSFITPNNNNNNINNIIQPKPEPIDDNEPLPQPIPISVSPPTQTSTSSLSSVYSEFDRLSQLFNTAFDSNNNSNALIPVPNPETQLAAPTKPIKYPTRSSELVRVTNLTLEDHRYYRNLVSKTRRLFDSFRVFYLHEDEKYRNNFIINNSNVPVQLPRRTSGALKAAAWMRKAGLWLNRDKRIVGDIPGIRVGDVFLSRMELCVVGLHGQVQAGIDYVSAGQSSNGEPIATSVIVSGGYEDDEDTDDVIVYTGHGGQDDKKKQIMHQKLECGNLALERSMCYGIEVRVIRGVKSGGGKVYVYDGLYRIVDTWFDVGRSGFGVYKFKLVRIDGQGEMGSVVMKKALSLKVRPLEVRETGYVSLDLSGKRERFPVYFFNDIDQDHDPLYHEYLVTTVFPSYVYEYGNGTGCDCVDECRDNCLCATRNGDGFAYDCNGTLVRGKPLVFECGPHCKCSSSCRNRVTQKGIQNRFEVFRSKETAWGVRSLDLIQAGSFICEYTGVVLTREQAQVFTMNGDSLIYASRFAEKWKEWGDLSQLFNDYVCPTYPSIPPLDFAMDVSIKRNVACYISQSSSPNVFVQPVLYDHNNVSFPHLMLFALENIPPMRELSLDYGVADEWTAKLAICN